MIDKKELGYEGFKWCDTCTSESSSSNSETIVKMGVLLVYARHNL